VSFESATAIRRRRRRSYDFTGLWLTEKTVETHANSILGKLGLPLDGDTHRRMLAIVTYLGGGAPT
jgi:hypothetical protein